MKSISIIAAVAASTGLAACGLTATQIQSYTAAVNATGALAKQIGQDIVVFDCNNAALIQVIAKDVNAATRVQATLDKNAKLATDVCPSLIGTPAIKVVSGS